MIHPIYNVCEVVGLSKLEKLLEDIEALERDLERVEHPGVKNVIRNMIARKQMAIAKIKALEDIRKRAYGR